MFLRTFIRGILMTTSAFILSRFTVSLAFLFITPVSPAKEPALSGFKAEILYHYREKISDGDAGEKRVSAPSTRREELPLVERQVKDGTAKRLLVARPKSLPFEIQIRITTIAQCAEFRVTLLDRKTREVVAGFPQTLEGPGSGEALTVELPLSDQQKTTLARQLLGEGEILTYVSLSLMAGE